MGPPQPAQADPPGQTLNAGHGLSLRASFTGLCISANARVSWSAAPLAGANKCASPRTQLTPLSLST